MEIPEREGERRSSINLGVSGSGSRLSGAYGSVFILSASLLALEITWMRLLDFQQWAHVASLVISLALLGFAASGLLIAKLQPGLRKGWKKTYALLSFLYAVSIPWTFVTLQQLPLDPFRLLWDPRQWLLFFVECLLLFLPFFLSASCIGLLFCVKRLSVSRVYFANLSGSGLGVLLALVLMLGFSLKGTLCLIALGGFLASVLCMRKERVSAWFHVVSSTTLVLSLLAMMLTPLWICPHKPLAKTLILPGVETVEEKTSPWGTVHLLKGPMLRGLPGLSLRYDREIPSGEVLFLDGDAIGWRMPSCSAMTHPLDFFPHLIQSLPYETLHKPSVLMMGAGSGMSALQALVQGAEKVTVVEQHPVLHGFISRWLEKIGAHRFPSQNRDLRHSEARGFLRSNKGLFDLITVDRLGSPTAAFAGAHAFRGDYLVTQEALADLFDHLQKDDGVLAFTTWLHMPPRDSLKLFASLVEMLERKEIPDPGRHLFVARNWSVGILLVFRSPLSREKVQALRAFCREHDFDLVYVPGIKQHETNRHHILESPIYHKALSAVLSGRAAGYLQAYPFQISPPTDDRPYFHHFLKWRKLDELWKEAGRDWVLLREWGYLVLWVTLISSVLLGGLLLLPVLLQGRRQKRFSEHGRREGRLSRLLFFGCLGGAFMMYELLFLEKCILFLSYPVLSVVLVLFAILVFSSLGGFATERFFQGITPESLIMKSCFLLALVGCVYAFGLTAVFRPLLGCSLWIRALIVFLVLAPPCFLMGFPFPAGVRWIRSRFQEDLPFCWGINGWTSVVFAAFTPILSIHLGLSRAFLCGTCLYFLAGCLGGLGVKDDPEPADVTITP